MAECFVGQILAVGFDYAPEGWLPCDGQLVSIAGNEVLFTLIGTTYGGDGTTNFALPDLRGRSPLGQGQGPGLSHRRLGEAGGNETVSLTAGQAGAHSHALAVSTSEGTAAKPANHLVLAPNSTPGFSLYAPAPATTALTADSVGSTGGGQAHENRQPYATINYIICAIGIYPQQA